MFSVIENVIYNDINVQSMQVVILGVRYDFQQQTF